MTVADMFAEAKPNRSANKRPSIEIERARMTAWLAQRIKQGESEFVVEAVTLTPVLAELLLQRNESNRTPSEAIVENYRRDIVAGRWVFNGQSLIVSRDGMLNDGQHRCLAVIAANAAIPVVLTFGVSRDSRFTVDQGRVRTSGDYLGMNGHTDANHVAAVAGFIWQWREKGRLSTSASDRATKTEVFSVADHYKDISDSIVIASRAGNASAGGKSVLAFCHWAISRNAPLTEATGFIERLIDGNDLGVRNPILLAKNRLATPNHRMKANEKVDLIFRAWNAHRRGERPTKLMALNGLLPKLAR